jgi:transcriptional regulator with XRE-family HTH domain
MSPTTNTTAKQIWKKLTDKDYRDSFVASNISNTVSSQIYTLRDQRGWTQKELAQRAGMNQSRIPALEDPNLENFEIGTLKRIASAFDVALVVRFVPFSELTNWTASLSEQNLSVPEFANDTLSQVSTNSSSAHIIQINVTAQAQPPGAALTSGTYFYGGSATCTASIPGGSQTIITDSRTMYSPFARPKSNSSPSSSMTTLQHSR